MPNNLSSLCGIINKIKEVMMVREGMYTKIGRGNSIKKKICKTGTNESVILRWVMQSRL
jgi:hypothetical protein